MNKKNFFNSREKWEPKNTLNRLFIMDKKNIGGKK